MNFVKFTYNLNIKVNQEMASNEFQVYQYLGKYIERINQTVWRPYISIEFKTSVGEGGG